jgi:sialic acid synthase SpsE
MGHTLVIAECGSCHDNDIDKAYALIEAAKECGADVAKFQYWSDSQKLYDQRKLTDPKYLEFYKHYQMPNEWLPLLKKRCEATGIEFMSTVYLPEDCCTLMAYQKRVKIANYEYRYRDLVDMACGHFDDVVISIPFDRMAGMRVVRERVSYLWCIPLYPTRTKDLSLKLYDKEIYCGLSDHTMSFITGALAVARGASIVEKHVRSTDTDPHNPDFVHSLAMDDKQFFQSSCFAEYVSNVREAEVAIG